jgi:uncharacterized surface protein with fasciclin (FAS1) repeats
MYGSKAPLSVLLASLILVSSLGSAFSYELIDIEEMLLEAEDIGRSLLQAAATNGEYGGYGSGGGYGGYGGYGGGYGGYGSTQQQAVTYRTQCTNQTNPTTLQVFVAMLQPTQPVSDSEVAQDSPSGMMTMYVDSRTGQAWVSGDISNVQNMTAVTVNAGNTTENGPVVLPLLPSASAISIDGAPTTLSNLTANSTAIQALYNASNNASGSNTQAGTAGTAGTAGGNTTQVPSVSINGFNPPLPFLSHFAFSQRLLTNATVPLLANATVNNTMGNMTGGKNSTVGNTAGAGNNANTAATTPDNNLSGNAIGVQPYKWANITQIMNTLGNGNVTVVTITRYSVNGSTSTTNITGGNSGNNGRESGTAGGNAFNASEHNSTNILALMQSGLAYVSVWTAQSGNSSELRGQIMPYGKVVGASPTISNAFPDALVPSPNFTTTSCRRVAVPAGTQERAQAGRGGASSGVTNDVYGADVIGNNYTAQARKTLPAVAAAMANLTSNTNNIMKGNYSIFTAAVEAAAQLFNGTATAAGGNSTARQAGGAGTTGRHLLQAAAGSTSARAVNATQGQGPVTKTGRPGGVTVFAPTNAAITKYLQSANISAQQFLANKTLLLKVLSFHIIPNEALTAVDLAKTNRAPTHQLTTLLPYNNVGYKLNNSGNATLYGTAGSSARIVDANMRSGNVIVQGIDGVLVPPSARGAKASGAAGNNTASSNTTATGQTAGGSAAAGRRLMKLFHLV